MTDSIHELFADLRRGYRAEWEARTTYGKLLFPAWAAWQAFELAFLFVFLGGLALFKRVVDRMEHYGREPLFEVYEDE
ncbi:hypothetical protein HPS36_02015 [Halorubrum salinarum]|uniref:Uncharacterized protein n=1 Tax=Halorubrum salinarum TaxID=2739057 RepID=A0A7D4C4D8_9EURY|nr:hypothetical protein [Halorubrum salinarum]QKG91678.1 hypothetical protein HPS36_02015 [Halorubrum salinarum]